MNTLQPLHEVVKTQRVRLLDVALIGPLMIAASYRKLDEPWATALFISGIATVIYNGANWFANENMLQSLQNGDDDAA